MDQLAENYHWNEETVIKETCTTEMYFKDGQKEISNIEFGTYENICEDIDYIYSWEEEDGYADIYHYTELTGEEHILNTNQISLMVMPLVSVEDAVALIEY